MCTLSLILSLSPPSHAHRPLRCLRLCDAAAMPSVGARAEAAAEALDLENRDLTSRSNAVQEAVPFSGAPGGSSTRPAVPAQGGISGQFAEGSNLECDAERAHMVVWPPFPDFCVCCGCVFRRHPTPLIPSHPIPPHTCERLEGRIVNEFEKFDKLTSVHINSTDDQLLASGYTYGVKLFDLATGQVRCGEKTWVGKARRFVWP